MPLCTQLFDYTHCRLVKNQKRKKKKNKKASLSTQVLIFLFSCSSRCRRLFTRASQQMASRKMGLARHQIEDSLDSLMILQPTKKTKRGCVRVCVCVTIFLDKWSDQHAPSLHQKNWKKKNIIFCFVFLFFLFLILFLIFSFIFLNTKIVILFCIHFFFFIPDLVWSLGALQEGKQTVNLIMQMFSITCTYFLMNSSPKLIDFFSFSILKMIRRCHPFWGKKKKRTSSCLRGRLRRTWLPGLR